MFCVVVSRQWKSLLVEELNKDEYNLRSDYLELILQVILVILLIVYVTL